MLDQIEVEVEEEFQPLSLDARFMSIRFNEDNRTVRDLWDKYTSEELVLAPDFQRNYVWDRPKASRYIESLLLDLPVPAIFLSDEEDGTQEVIDGQQRLTSIFKFLSPLARKSIGTAASTSLDPLTLTGLEVLSNLNGKNVTALSIPDRSKVWDRLIKTLSLPTDVHPDMKFELFARLNLGSLSLNPQELRNCIFRGPYNDTISELSTDHAFLGLWGKTTPDKRMAHREYVLRFFAFLHRRETYATSQKSFLNSEMKAYQNMNEDKWTAEFQLATKWVERIFGKEAFKRFTLGNEDNPAGRWVSQRSVQLFVLEMVAFAEMGDRLNEIWELLNEEEQQMFRDAVRRQLAMVMSEPRFADTLSDGTTRPDKVRYRFDKWISAVSGLVTNPDKFLGEMRGIYESLQKSESCAVCSSNVNSEDATWRVSPQGRELVHRYCAS